MQLTNDQEAAFKKIQEFLNNHEKTVFGFFGHAGTGKTTLLNRIVKRYEGQVCNTASTNKATSVMKYFHKNFGSGSGNEEFVTTYKLFGYKLVPTYNAEEDEWEDKMVKSNMWDFPFDDQGIFPPLVIIDESSMIPQWFYDKLVDYAEEFNLKLLFVGDSGQLPPVKEKTSPVFTLAENEDAHILMKEIVRQSSGSKILEVATSIRNNILQEKFDFSTILPKEHIVKTREQLGDIALEYFKKGNDFTDTKIIAWRNKTVAWYNTYIRSSLRGPVLPKECPFIVGDPVVSKKPVYKGLENVLYTSQEMIVQAISESTRSGIKTYAITLKSKYEPKVTVHMVRPSNYKTYLSKCKWYKTKAQRSDDPRDWAIYRQFAYGFAELDFSYAITSHRAQGSTYKNVFIDMTDICDNPNIEERNKCLYVAASRPTESIYIKQ